MSASGWRHRAEKRGGCFMRKRLLSGLLAVSMMFSLCPASAFADDTRGGISPDAVSVQEVDTENDAADPQ